ncbi:MAG: ABC transporter permease [Mesorhizobium sp.]|uniref:ABC transporter permease n=1 Tax=unclassified Mesorhizobium TaxID=325217 RepID=UPI000F74C85C|nr:MULTISPECIES: ABC transporter permease [unclassified Mesorhizobium]AZO74361.1 ABC transporter permease [Mesorhizobium sp. M1D.F.Ca.ET.043.01.1.1]RWA96766.1 MAG: ABC transporter permease subunit [Mesorhizobium sp.]RWE17774.1 MAG: ABC transporter permease subunit [Mesorhizobium sp.]TJW81557.1 MAG: ABC transporter permease [Mesorhizobium sp.]
MIDLHFFVDIIPTLLSGLPLTLQLAGLSIAIGFVLALLLALAQQGNHRMLVWPIRAFVAVFRGTPLLVQIFLIYYGLGQFRSTLQAVGLWWLFREPCWCAIIALSLNTAAYGSEILRGAIQGVPRGLVEAASAFGMTRIQTLRLVILPLALRQAIPSYSNEIILMVKGTSLASIVTLMEVTGIAQGLISQTYRAVEVFVAAGAIYLTINFTIISALNALETWLTPYRVRA